jgi:tetratricopeptide (TPR) repeat protein
LEILFYHAINKYGPNARAYQDLAESQNLLGKYDKSLISLEYAAKLNPSDLALRNKIRQAKRLLEVRDLASAGLPDNHVVLRVASSPYTRNSESWLVLSANETKDDQNWTTYTDVRLNVFNNIHGQMRSVYQSTTLGFPGFADGEFNHIRLFLVDLNGDGLKEIAIPMQKQGAWWSPSHLDIFGDRNDSLVHLIGMNSSFPVKVVDINKDGKYEMISESFIGADISHAEQPWWRDIYAWKNSTYQLANGDFPHAFDAMRSEIKGLLRRYPHDFDLWLYLGIVDQIQKHKAAALRAYRRAEHEAIYYMNKSQNPYEHTREYCETSLVKIRNRISSLNKSAPQ